MKIIEVILVTLVIFTAGVVTGVAVGELRMKEEQPSHASSPMSSANRRAFLERLDHQLSLSSEQKQAIERILQARQARVRELWAPITPQIHEEFRQTRTEIVAQLTLAQQKIFEEKFKSREARAHEEASRRDGRRKRIPRSETPGSGETGP